MASFTFPFDQHDEIPLMLRGPERDTVFQAGFAVGTAYVTDEDGEPCITDIVLGISPAVRMFAWRMANREDQHCFEQMRVALMASERFNDAMDDAGAFRVRGLRKVAA